MQQPSLCVIHEAISHDSAIARVAFDGVKIALDAQFRVSVVAKILDSSLVGKVEWLKLMVPPRLFLLQWSTAGAFIRAAIGKRRFDIVHAHQPQAASISDVFSCHFLTRVAYERKCLETRSSFRARVVRLQQQGVLYAEDACYRKWNARTHALFVSGLLKTDFERLYGLPPRHSVLVNPFPPVCLPSNFERIQARKELVGDYQGPVVGYLGGVQERKGYRRLIRASAHGDNVPTGTNDKPFLLIGGPFTEGLIIPELQGRYRSTGMVSNIDRFYAACDVFAIPSCFEPLGLVAFEAVARGVPVIATREVGALPHLLETGTGVAWDPADPLDPIISHLTAPQTDFRQRVNRMHAAYGTSRFGENLLGVYEKMLSRGWRGQVASAGVDDSSARRAVRSSMD